MLYADQSFGYQDPRGAKPGSLTLARRLIDYLERCNELGLKLDGDGKFMIDEDLQPVMLALHTVLAGGRIEVNVQEPGNPDIVHELNRRVAEGLADATELNRLAGYYLSAGV